MNKARESARVLAGLISALPVARRRQLGGLAALMVAAAIAEIASLGALVPFLSLLAAPRDSAYASGLTAWLQTNLGIEPSVAIVPITAAFVVIVIIAAAVRVALNVVLARMNFRVGHEIGSLIYSCALAQPYEYHVRHNSAEIVGGVVKVDTAIFVLLAVLIGISSAFIAACIAATLLVINAIVAIAAVVGFGGAYFVVSQVIHARLLTNGRTVNSATPKRLQAMQEGLGGIRDVILDHTQAFHQRRFDTVDRSLRLAQESNQILGPTPRYLIEAIGMIIVAVIACWYTIRGGGVATALPTLGVLVLGGQRLLPLLQQAYQGWVMITGHLAVVDDVTRLLSAAQPNCPLRPSTHATARLKFNREILFEDVGFRFEGAERDVLRDVAISIPAGARVGIVGPTGSGKSTLLNLMMGLLTPTQGLIRVDGELIDADRRTQWQRSIAHVPQSIFLADGTILENVAFGIPHEQIDANLVRQALARAQLTAFIQSLPKGADTFVGENGVRLSGGQRQRLGIARALYKQATVLVLDEATSALDEQTEAEVMHSVEALERNITLIMIAHRLSTLRSCDFLLRVQDGFVRRISTDPSPPSPAA